MKQTANLRSGVLVLTLAFVLTSGFSADETKSPVKATQINESRLAPELVGVAKLLQSGVDQKVVLSFIANSPLRRSPTAEELVYLHDLGLSSEGMVALLNSAPKASPTQESISSVAPADSRLPQTTTQQQQSVQRPAPAASPDLVAAATQPAPNAVISSQPQVVYTQPTPTTVYVQTPPAVTYVPSYPTFSFGFGLGHHVFGHHGAGHYSGHGGGHHGGGHH